MASSLPPGFEPLTPLIDRARSLPGPGFLSTSTPGGSIVVPNRRAPRDAPHPFQAELFNDEGTIKLRIIETGFAWMTIDNQVSGEENNQLPTLSSWPVIPKIGANEINSTPLPSLSLTLSSINVIVLQATLAERDENIGSYETTSGAEDWYIDVEHGLDVAGTTDADTHDHDFTTDSAGDPSHTHTGTTDEDTHSHNLTSAYISGTIKARFKERNYHMAAAPTFIKITSDNAAGFVETELTINRLAGFFELDADGAVTSWDWFLTSDIDQFQRYGGHVWADHTSSPRTPTGPSTPTVTDIPTWEE